MSLASFSQKRRWSLGALVLAALILIVLARAWQGRAPRAATIPQIPVVEVARVDHEDLFKEITVPAEFRPYTEVELHAKVSGYVKEMKVDIGDRVKTGQLLAVLEVPELHDDFDHAVANERRAQASYRDAHLGYTRLVAVNKDRPNLIAQQDLDTAEARDATAQGGLEEAKADVEKYQTMVSYTRIVAPFDGVITKRYADPGSLIQAGTTSNTQAMPLVRVSNNMLLRLDFPVSVDYVHGIRLETPLRVRVESLGGRVLTGKIARFSDRVDDSTRTMIAEMEVPNPSLEVVPGMYASVVLKVDEHPRALAIPIEALPAGGGSVLLVNAAGEIEERAIKPGLETQTRYEVLGGLKQGDLVVIGNRGQLVAGQKVEPRIIAPLARE
ncbi:MAG TPA: efflux RND transporter periplasmic adaptor subunit [Steroidobacteraceae bacterium]|jgi:RND family efflux transporter MFP subunit|nr:efflux RND transporter periplasmic adaptor subunit [Steroidobacteraceae bacterium]